MKVTKTSTTTTTKENQKVEMSMTLCCWHDQNIFCTTFKATTMSFDFGGGAFVTNSNQMEFNLNGTLYLFCVGSILPSRRCEWRFFLLLEKHFWHEFYIRFWESFLRVDVIMLFSHGEVIKL
jgi:hypothetical protein